MNRYAWVGAAAVACALSAGCVERRFVINSEPQGALVYVNGQYLGATPVDFYYVYYGKYEFKVVKAGFEPLTVSQPVPPPWYEWPGIDFIAENVVPVKLRDVRSFCYTLQPAQTVRPDDLLNRATQLRARGQGIGQPKPQPVPAPAAPAAGPPVPPGAPVPTLGPPRAVPAPGPPGPGPVNAP
jgi:hypothetical protein